MNSQKLEIPPRRNYVLDSHRRDGFIEWMKDILRHSFVLDAPETYLDSFSFFESLVEEHKTNPDHSRLKQYIPNIGKFHTELPLRAAFSKYDTKYCISERHYIPPSFHELRHICNLAQVMALNRTLSMITFDGDQTLYSDGENFESNVELADQIIDLMKSGVKVAVITAAGYGLDGAKYAVRLQGLLQSFIIAGLNEAQVGSFYVFGGECNYLLRAHLIDTPVAAKDSSSSSSASCKSIELIPVPIEVYQHPSFKCPKPSTWTAKQVSQILDTAEHVMRDSVGKMKLRARILRKERSVGVFPGGDGMVSTVPVGHGSKKIKQEALDELVLRILDALRQASPPIEIPYCVFNGGRDCWIDVGNKAVAAEILQEYLGLRPETCLHVGDQFLQLGNDFACRDVCPCIWITSPSETEKILAHILKFKKEGFGTSIEQDEHISERHSSRKPPSHLTLSHSSAHDSGLDRRFLAQSPMKIAAPYSPQSSKGKFNVFTGAIES